jgi:hypothetical protein
MNAPIYARLSGDPSHILFDTSDPAWMIQNNRPANGACQISIGFHAVIPVDEGVPNPLRTSGIDIICIHDSRVRGLLFLHCELASKTMNPCIMRVVSVT